MFAMSFYFFDHIFLWGLECKVNGRLSIPLRTSALPNCFLVSYCFLFHLRYTCVGVCAHKYVKYDKMLYLKFVLLFLPSSQVIKVSFYMEYIFLLEEKNPTY